MYSLSISISNLSLYGQVIQVELIGSSGIVCVGLSFKKSLGCVELKHVLGKICHDGAEGETEAEGGPDACQDHLQGQWLQASSPGPSLGLHTPWGGWGRRLRNGPKEMSSPTPGAAATSTPRGQSQDLGLTLESVEKCHWVH